MAKIKLEKILLQRAKDFFEHNIVGSHLEALENASTLKDYNVNPFLLTYLANFLDGDATPRSLAKALIYPRILGTSANTIFGMKAQKMIHEIFEGYGSMTDGLDIEFIDATDGRKKYCQIKSGPNTINKDDITTILNHFKGIRNIARTNNNKGIGVNDLIVGVLYGTPEELSSHYIKISGSHPVYIGKEFWYRLTGSENFYFKLIAVIGEVALDIDGREKLEQAITSLAAEIEATF
jgi:hypothetical protein